MFNAGKSHTLAIEMGGWLISSPEHWWEESTLLLFHAGAPQRKALKCISKTGGLVRVPGCTSSFIIREIAKLTWVSMPETGPGMKTSAVFRNSSKKMR